MLNVRRPFLLLQFFTALFFVVGYSGLSRAEGAAVVLEDFKAWSLHQSRSASHNICYVAAMPSQKTPTAANRAAVVFYISTWPKDGVRSEVSVKLGYPIKPTTKVTVTIGSETFDLQARTERAYVYDATQELKLIDAMKSGSSMTVTGLSERGTKTSDTYSLSGITAALKAMADRCS
jgi:invasion protein IalB